MTNPEPPKVLLQAQLARTEARNYLAEAFGPDWEGLVKLDWKRSRTALDKLQELLVRWFFLGCNASRRLDE